MNVYKHGLKVVSDDDQKLKMQILGNLAQAMLLFNVELADAVNYCNQAIEIADAIEDSTFKLKCLLRKTRAYFNMSTSKNKCFITEAKESLALGLQLATDSFKSQID